MSGVIQLTAGVELARGFSARQSNSVSPPSSEAVAVDVFAVDRLSISKASLELHQRDTYIQANTESADQPNEAVFVDSTVGLSRSKSGLTELQAVKLYQAVARLL